VISYSPRFIQSLLLASAALGCSVIVDADRPQCETTADCTNRGAAFADAVCISNLCQPDPRWGCLSSPASTPDPGPFDVTMHARDLIMNMPVANVDALLCSKLDLTCTTPLATARTDVAGAVTWHVEGGFAGYTAFQSPATVQSLYFFNPPISHSEDIPPVSLPSPEGRAALVQHLGGSIELGDILATALDCTGAPAAGIKFVLEPHSPSVVQFYLTAGLPSPIATSSDATGYGGFFSVAPGTYTLKGIIESSSITLDTVSVTVNAGASSWTRLVAHGS